VSFLERWSRKKHETKRPAPPAEEGPPVVSPAVAAPPAVAETPLPPVESLTPESDFTPFLRDGVDARLKRQALKTLFQDPRFNVMDGLDVYIDDYSKPDPLPEGWLEKLNQVARLGEYREPEPVAEPPEKGEGEAQAVAPEEPAERAGDGEGPAGAQEPSAAPKPV
jgi:hypothetical protein